MGCKRSFTMANKWGGVETIRVFSEKFSHPFVERAVDREHFKFVRRLHKISRVDP